MGTHRAYVVIASHFEEWDRMSDGSVKISTDESTVEVVVGVYTTLRLMKKGVLAYFEKHEPDEDMYGPIEVIRVYRAGLNCEGSHWVNEFHPIVGWRKPIR